MDLVQKPRRGRPPGSGTGKKQRIIPECVGSFNVNNNQLSKQSIVNIPRQYLVQLDVSLSDVNNLENPISYTTLVQELNLPVQIEESLIIPNLYPTKIKTICPSTVLVKCSHDKNKMNDVKESFTSEISNQNLNTFKESILFPLLSTNNGEQWPTTSIYPCTNCELYFDGIPFGIPLYEFENKIRCCGNFCSTKCVHRHIRHYLSETDYWQSYSLLCNIESLLYDEIGLKSVDMAPPKECRQKYGGNLTDDEYRQIIFNNSPIIADVYHLPIYPVQLHMYQINKNLNINMIAEINSKNSTKLSIKSKESLPVDLESAKKSAELLKSLINTKQPLKANCF